MEYCVCGHLKNKHFSVCIHTEIAFSKDGFKGLWKCSCRGLKLDNLKLIEDLAKEKGLV